MVEEILVKPNKDKVFKFIAYDRQGRTARGITKEHAISQYHLLYDNKITPFVTNMNGVPKINIGDCK